jgi:hypothetical protein
MNMDRNDGEISRMKAEIETTMELGVKTDQKLSAQDEQGEGESDQVFDARMREGVQSR